jgi:hypothetical protein
MHTLRHLFLQQSLKQFLPKHPPIFIPHLLFIAFTLVHQSVEICTDGCTVDDAVEGCAFFALEDDY